MFQWMRTADGSKAFLGEERYFVNVGDIWGGTVWSFGSSFGKPRWAARYTILGKDMRGGLSDTSFDTREAAMDYVEGRISQSLKAVSGVIQAPFRKIYNSWDEMGERGESYLDYLHI